MARLHGTELVVSQKSGVPAKVAGGDYGELVAEIKKLREELQAANYAIAKNTNKSAKVFERWDVDGLPDTRTVV
jgi:hypothetical protein